jgi:hypothetical protein
MRIGPGTPDYGAQLPAMLKLLDGTNGSNPHYRQSALLGWPRHSYKCLMRIEAYPPGFVLRRYA